MYDTVIHGGEVVDGTGGAVVRADVGILDGVIALVAPHIDLSQATEAFDATGCIVTPGFVDVHSHYDGQITWDEVLEPSTPHGVTTVVTGNCGVGFAPVRPGTEGWLIQLMEGVEDIPGAALHEGMTWGWETFPEYLDLLSSRTWAADVGVQLPHGPLRSYVMGKRAGNNEQATPDEIAEMCRLAGEAMEAGAFGFTTSRTLAHLAADGTPVPGTFADDGELFSIARAVSASGGRIFEVAAAGIVPNDDPAVVSTEIERLGELAAETGLTVTFIVIQHSQEPTRWRQEMDAAAQWRASGSNVVPLVAGRPFGILWGWDVRHPFRHRPSYEAVAHLPLAERVEALRDPVVRANILSETSADATDAASIGQRFVTGSLPRCYPMTGTPDYEPPASQSLRALAAASGDSVEALAYDIMMSDDGHGMLLLPMFNYADKNHDVLYEQMQDPAAILGLADGGAHCGAICDASIPTYVLTHWVRDRTRGPRIELADAVRRLTSQTADLYGFTDRGRIEVGKRADINVIDFQHLQLETPRAVSDLPAGGTRLLQGATGYRATFVNGEMTRRDGVDTGARPGRLVRATT